MKKILILIMSAVLVMSLLSCSGTETPTGTVPSSESSGSVATTASSEENTASSESSPSYTGPSLKEKLSVPDHIKDSFQSKSGISQVYVDADITMPDAGRADVIAALPREHTDEEILSIAKYFEPEGGWTADNGVPWDGTVEGGKVQLDDPGEKEYDHFWLYLTNIPSEVRELKNRNEVMQWYRDHPEFTQKTLEYDYEKLRSTGDLMFKPRFEYRRSNSPVSAGDIWPFDEEGNAIHCTITLEEALKMADQVVQAVAPDYRLTDYGPSPLTESGFLENKTRQVYQFRYTCHLNGIPVTSCLNGEYRGAVEGGYGYVASFGVISVLVDDDGIVYFNYINPTDQGDTIETDVHLLPFEDIWDIFSHDFLLTFQHYEVNNPDLQESIREIKEIRFGYMPVLQPDGSYRYTPVWDFLGTSVMKGTGGYAAWKEWYVPTYTESLFTINAIDGTIIDRDLGY